MKLLFSESQADCDHYIYPYAIWAFPEPGETPADLFHQGFLPSSRNLERFYLCRQLRVDLRGLALSSENRRILRKGEGVSAQLVPREAFDYTPQRRQFFLEYAAVRFGRDVMTGARLDSLFQAKVTSHLLVFTDSATHREVGCVTLYLEPPTLAFYYYAFYDLNYLSRNLGMFMMTHSATLLADRGFHFLYLGSCYRPNALYKTQFSSAQFFNGVRWSDNLEELKYLLSRSHVDHHLLEDEDYCQSFYRQTPAQIAASSPFRVDLKAGS